MDNAPTITTSAEETIARGRELAARLEPPVLILLSGELGAGKTTFAKGIISGLGAAPEDEVTSPTFTLVHTFIGRPKAQSQTQSQTLSPVEGSAVEGWKVFHVDLYRVNGLHDLETLGLEDILSTPAADGPERGRRVVIVEWPERLTLRTDWPVVSVQLLHLEADRRQIRILDSAAAGPERSRRSALTHGPE